MTKYNRSKHILHRATPFILISFLLLITLFLISCSNSPQDGPNSSDKSTDSLTTTSSSAASTTSTPETTSSQPPSINSSHNETRLLTLEETIQEMTLEEKVAQLFIVDFYGMTNTYQVKSITSEMENFLNNYPVGGIIYFAENIESRQQLQSMNTNFQSKSSIPLFISIDEEGGLVSRLGKSNVGVTHLDSANVLSKRSVEEVNQLAYALGLEIKELGFNMDFAPVMDVNTNPDNPVIGNRSFSSTPQVVADYSLAFSQGLNQSGIISSGKHFPGHGDTQTDSHLGITIIEHDLNRLESVELIPFIEAINEGVPSIMMGHISTPNITGDNIPASLSKYMITTLLREKLGYEGLVLTDSLRMEAITDYYSPKDIGADLLLAGGDMFLIPMDFIQTYNGILEAVENGILSEERINTSVYRILKVKSDYSLMTFKNQ